MSKTPFDIDRIRRKWDLVTEPDAGNSGRVEAVRAPLDPFASARSELGRVRQLVLGSFEARASSLTPLLDRADGIVDRLERALAPAGDVAEVDELRAELHTVLYDLEDLLEVYSFVGP